LLEREQTREAIAPLQRSRVVSQQRLKHLQSFYHDILPAAFIVVCKRDWTAAVRMLVCVDGDVERELAVPVDHAARFRKGLRNLKNRRAFAHDL
jgi:hypothetical protein